MKKNKIGLAILAVALWCLPSQIFASTCDSAESAELISKSSMVSVAYETKEIPLPLENYPTGDQGGVIEDELFYTVIDIIVLNMSEEFYIEVTNNKDAKSFIIKYSDFVDGKYSFTQSDMSKIISYTFSVYASSKTNCEGTRYDVKYQIVPKYNYLSTNDACIGFEDTSVCQEYTTVEGLTEGDLYMQTIFKNSNDDTSDDVEDEENKILKFFKDNYIWLSIGGIVIIAGIITVVIISKRRSDLK